MLYPLKSLEEVVSCLSKGAVLTRSASYQDGGTRTSTVMSPLQAENQFDKLTITKKKTGLKSSHQKSYIKLSIKVKGKFR